MAVGRGDDHGLDALVRHLDGGEAWPGNPGRRQAAEPPTKTGGAGRDDELVTAGHSVRVRVGLVAGLSGASARAQNPMDLQVCSIGWAICSILRMSLRATRFFQKHATSDITIDTIRDAARHVYDVAVRTPLLPLGVLVDGEPELFFSSSLKRCSPSDRFKIRGAYNAVRRLDRHRARAGRLDGLEPANSRPGASRSHAKGITAQRCSVMVMDTAPEAKLGAIARLGATIVQGDLRRMLESGRDARLAST